MPSLGNTYTHIKQVLKEKGLHLENAESDARYIIAKRTGKSWADILGTPEYKLTERQKNTLYGDLDRHIKGEPLSRIYGEREFYGLNFKINEATLDPRFDTEILVDKASQYAKTKKVSTLLDLGTGSGCILLALLSNIPEAIGIGIDCSISALEVARENAKIHSMEDRSFFICADWATPVASQTFDLIVSNPPYIASDMIPSLSSHVQNHDPVKALDGGKKGLECYKKIFSALKNIMKPDGTAFFEIGYDQEKDIMRLVEESTLSLKHVHRDLAGMPRVAEIHCGDK